MNQVYLDTARLLIQVAPLVFAEKIFALKGGTAINLFVRDMPRLSVDLDLVFADHSMGREEALDSISAAIKSAGERLKKRGFQTHAATVADAGETKLFIRRENLEVKVEVNFVLRGTLHPVRPASLSAKAKEVLQADLELPLVSLEDLYAGKLVAALDRQHPRDLFDVMELFSREGITPAIRRSFVAYLATHNRPIHEVLFPKLRDVSGEYEPRKVKSEEAQRAGRRSRAAPRNVGGRDQPQKSRRLLAQLSSGRALRGGPVRRRGGPSGLAGWASNLRVGRRSGNCEGASR